MKMDDGAGNEHDYNDNHDLAKILNSKSIMTQSLNSAGLTVMTLMLLFFSF